MTIMTPDVKSEEIARRGWRPVKVVRPDGSFRYEMEPLTSEEFLHPKEGYHLPNSTFHDTMAGDVKDMLARRYRHDPAVGVFRDLIIVWGPPDMPDNCPDTFVAQGIRDKDRNRERYYVALEGVLPSLIVEVVSPHYRKEDRVIKVEEYEKARVPEYIIIDRRVRRGQVSYEILGYEFHAGRYRPKSPDDMGRIFCETVGVWMSLEDGRVVIEDAETGERLLTSLEEQAAREAAELRIQDLERRLQLLQAELDRR